MPRSLQTTMVSHFLLCASSTMAVNASRPLKNHIFWVYETNSAPTQEKNSTLLSWQNSSAVFTSNIIPANRKKTSLQVHQIRWCFLQKIHWFWGGEAKHFQEWCCAPKVNRTSSSHQLPWAARTAPVAFVPADLRICLLNTRIFFLFQITIH